MRERIYRFMQGRNGMDELARFESILLWVVLILSLIASRFSGNTIGMICGILCNILFWAILIHMYFRVFSKNLSRRYEENQKFMNFRYEATVKKNKAKRRAQQKKTYAFFKCPMCQQEVRVPKGHGRIEITCPKCREKFVRKS